MKILITTHWFPPIQAGSSYYASSLAQALHARGHKVRVVTLDWGLEYQTSSDLPFPVERFPVIRLPRLPVFYNMKFMGFAFTPDNFRRLQTLVREYKPDVIQHVNHIFDMSFLSLVVGRREAIPVFGSINTPIQHPNVFLQSVMEFLDRITVGQAVRRWDGIVSLDQTAHHYVGHVYGSCVQKKSEIIPFGVPIESESLYENDGIEKSARPQILMVGHIHPFRNPVQLVRAMPLILREVPEVRLVLAGRVDIQKPIVVARSLGLSEDQVSFLGETPHNEIVRLMKSSHVFASWVTGPYPGLGTAPMEAMLCRTPVINDLPGNLFGEGRLKNGENIVLVNSKDPHSIADAIIHLLRNEPTRLKVGAAGRQFVLDHLSWENIAMRFENFYQRVLAKRGILKEKREPLAVPSEHLGA